jgi:hypothetical protein
MVLDSRVTSFLPVTPVLHTSMVDIPIQHDNVFYCWLPHLEAFHIF